MSPIEIIDGGFFNKNLKFIGYGVYTSKKKREDIEIKSTKAYKALRPLFLDSITIEISAPEENRRTELEKLIEENVLRDKDGNPVYNEDVAIVIPNIETLGSNIEIVTENYYKIFNYLNIVILNYKGLSTCSLNREIHREILDTDDEYRYAEELSCVRLSARGRKTLQMTRKFRKVFWEWQNYFIDTKQACELLECSHGSLYKLSQEFMTKSYFRRVYGEEFAYLRNFEDKPVRGITLDEDTIKVLVFLQRELGDNWEEYKISHMCYENDEFRNMTQTYYYIDYIRLRLNYMYGHAKIIEAAKKYKKDDEYFNKLKSEIEKL